MKAREVGPIYGVELLVSLPLDGGMTQALPSRKDLDDVRRTKINGNDRVVAGYEVLLEHYRRELAENARLRGMIDQTADGALVPDCEEMYCPKCCGPLRLEYDIAYCDSCVNPDDGGSENRPPLPLLFSSCYSRREAAKAARDET